MHEPSPDIWEKIKQKREIKQAGSSTINSFRFYLLRIAAVLLIATLSIIAYDRITKNKQEKPIAGNENERMMDPEIVELMEAEVYYTNQLNLKMKKLESYSTDFKDIRDDVLSDFKELDAAYIELVDELGSDIYKQEVIESMIEVYRLKLKILEEVLKQLEGWSNDNSSDLKEI